MLTWRGEGMAAAWLTTGDGGGVMWRGEINGVNGGNGSGDAARHQQRHGASPA